MSNCEICMGECEIAEIAESTPVSEKVWVILINGTFEAVFGDYESAIKHLQGPKNKEMSWELFSVDVQ
jgi:hypothetical protein